MSHPIYRTRVQLALPPGASGRVQSVLSHTTFPASNVSVEQNASDYRADLKRALLPGDSDAFLHRI